MRPEVVVFAGPSVDAATVERLLPGAVVMPPAACSDVLIAAKRQPFAIALIDGIFEAAPAVWHKEILYAMSQGVHVFGCSSMGALRAAELAAFGMHGRGVVYELVRNGDIDDDDVAVAHADEEFEFRALSEPLVNIHVTLDDAVAAEIISRPLADRIRGLAKQRYYPERTFASLCEDARAAEMEAHSLDRFEEWVRHGRRDVKREDAEQLLIELAELRESGHGPHEPTFELERTTFFRALETFAVTTAQPPGTKHGSIVDEVRLDPDRWATILRAASARALASLVAGYEQQPVTAEIIDRTSDDVRRALGLHAVEDFYGWLEGSRLSEADYTDLVHGEARRRLAEEAHAHLIERAIVDELHLSGHYREVSENAGAKADLDARPWLASAGGHAEEPTDDEFLEVFFGERGVEAVTDDHVAWDHAARGAGFADAGTLARLLRRTWRLEQVRASSEVD